jgi:hypothetical protein
VNNQVISNLILNIHNQIDQKLDLEIGNVRVDSTIIQIVSIVTNAKVQNQCNNNDMLLSDNNGKM